MRHCRVTLCLDLRAAWISTSKSSISSTTRRSCKQRAPNKTLFHRWSARRKLASRWAHYPYLPLACLNSHKGSPSQEKAKAPKIQQREASDPSPRKTNLSPTARAPTKQKKMNKLTQTKLQQRKSSRRVTTEKRMTEIVNWLPGHSWEEFELKPTSLFKSWTMLPQFWSLADPYVPHISPSSCEEV